MNKIVIETAIKGGWTLGPHIDKLPLSNKQLEVLTEVHSNGNLRETVCDPNFWQALGKAKGWDKEKPRHKCCGMINEDAVSWKETALKFHEINLTDGWESAIKYLEDLITNE